MRRMRRDEFSRRLMRETRFSTDDLIFPIFIVEGNKQRQPIESMPGIFRLSIDELLVEAADLIELDIPAVTLFPSLGDSAKSLDGKEAYNSDGLVQRAIRALKESFPPTRRNYRRCLGPLHDSWPRRHNRCRRLCAQR